MKTKNQIIMTIQDTHEVILNIAGNGSMTIDLGYENPSQTHTLSDNYEYYHEYGDYSTNNISRIKDTKTQCNFYC